MLPSAGGCSLPRLAERVPFFALTFFRPASAAGGWFGGAGLTVTVTSAVALNSESFAVRRRTYVPSAVKAASVLRFVGLPKVTVPGPLSLLQETVSTPPAGRPSSVAVPLRL